MKRKALFMQNVCFMLQAGSMALIYIGISSCLYLNEIWTKASKNNYIQKMDMHCGLIYNGY